MGYQESYVTVNNQNEFQKLVKTFQKLGLEHFNCRDIRPVEIITLKKDINVNLSAQCQPDINKHYSIGSKFIYVCGERHYQRSVTLMLGNNINDGIEIIFTECFPSDEIFNKNNPIAEHQKFVF